MKYFEDTLRILTDSIKGLDESKFEKLLKKCNEVIDDGNKIIVSGLGKNVAICDKFVGSMVSLGMPAYFLHTNSAVHGDMGLIKPGDLVIILTKSGETTESIYLTELIKKIEGVNLWLLTFNKESTLTKMIDDCYVIDLEHEGDMWNLLPINSSTMNLIFLQVLAIELAKLRKIDIKEFKKNHPGGHIGQTLAGK